MDSLRERAFSGLDSFLEPEEPKTGGRRIFLMLLLLAALGGAGWWIYTNYLGTGLNRKTETTASNASETPADTPSQSETQPQSETAAAPDAGASPSAPPSSSSSVPEGPSENAGPTPDTAGSTPDTAPEKPAAVAKAPAAPVAAAPISKREARREARLAHPKTAKPPAPEPEDTGDAAFRKGEAYLYGRGAPENCDEAIKNLKAASAKSNAKARSAFGTMYATGHCVPRDLPTSYTWFALALRADPNNQILEKDLTAIWNQMTPPERQLATRMKQ
jgi:TPR repeat protein